MKKLIYIVLLSIAPMFAFSQVYVKAPNGDVGVGMDTPTEKLEVAGLAKTDGNTVVVTGASATSLYERTDGAAVLTGAGFSGAGFTFDENYNFEIRSRGRSFIQSRLLSAGYLFLRARGTTGNVGINVSNPSTKLHVNGSITYNGALNNASDRRLKTNINNFKYGLDEVLQLNPVNYSYNGKAGFSNAGQNQVGLVAQDLQKVAPELVSTFTYEEENEEAKVVRSEDYLMISESSIKYMLVNAVKEQQEIIEAQDEKIATLEERLAKIEAALNGTINTDINRQNIQLDGTGAYLEQNQPNPFNSNTLINYHVPADAGDAMINIFDAKGQLIHSERIAQMGTGQIQIKAGTIAAGTYSYSLIVNGNVLDTKRMVIAK